MSGSLPLVMTLAGPQPTPPATLRAALVAGVASIVPDYTANIPGLLIEDLASTCAGALIAIDQARVDSVNDVTPLGANAFVLAAQGVQLGIPQGQGANGSVLVEFTTTGAAGYVFPPGFQVGDGTNIYSLTDGGVIQTNLSTGLLGATALSSGTFAIPADTVTQIVTSLPSPYNTQISVTNPSAGIPASTTETVTSYRAQILQGSVVASTGTPAYVKTLLYQITGVQQPLVSIPAVSGGWQIICGGGDPYAVANAILQGVGDISALVGSALEITGITAATNAVITTNLNHNFIIGQTVTVSGSSVSGYNTTYVITAVTATTITTSRNSSGFGAFTGTAQFSPNPRNVSVSLFQNPNTYNILYVNPPQQVVAVAATWNTTLPSFTAGASVNQLAIPAMAAYINSIYVGQPINLLELTAVFQNAVASVLPTVNLTTLTFAVTINGVTATPGAGTSAISSDPESYFNCSPTGATSVQG